MIQEGHDRNNNFPGHNSETKDSETDPLDQKEKGTRAWDGKGEKKVGNDTQEDQRGRRKKKKKKRKERD